MGRRNIKRTIWHLIKFSKFTSKIRTLSTFKVNSFQIPPLRWIYQEFHPSSLSSKPPPSHPMFSNHTTHKAKISNLFPVTCPSRTSRQMIQFLQLARLLWEATMKIFWKRFQRFSQNRTLMKSQTLLSNCQRVSAAELPSTIQIRNSAFQ